jgi:glycosyltransferase involved in cell wall biosynthesis
VFNEEENLRDLYQEITLSLAGLTCEWEMVLVDDGSTDSSSSIIRELSAADSRVRFVSFAGNCGQSAAFSAGFRFAGGDVVVTLDADLQNDPADIPGMLKVYEQGVDMVIGWRVKRQDSWVKKYASRLANWVRHGVLPEGHARGNGQGHTHVYGHAPFSSHAHEARRGSGGRGSSQSPAA